MAKKTIIFDERQTNDAIAEAIKKGRAQAAKKNSTKKAVKKATPKKKAATKKK